MRVSLYSFYAKFERSDYKAAILVSAAVFFISLRVLFEFVSSGIFIETNRVPILLLVIQWFLWYSATFLMVLVCFRFVARIPLKSVLYLLLLTVFAAVPILAAGLSGVGTRFSYLTYHDPGLFKSIMSFMYFSPANHYMFYEFLLIAVVVSAVAYVFSKSVLRSVLTPLSMYLALIFLQAFVYICSDAVQCVFAAPSSIRLHIFVCLYFIVVVCAWLCAFLLPELRRYTRADNTIFTQTNLIKALVLFIPYGIASLLISGYFFDLLFLFLSYFIFFYVSLFLYKHWKERELIGLNTFLAIYGGLILATFSLTALRFFS